MTFPYKRIVNRSLIELGEFRIDYYYWYNRGVCVRGSLENSFDRWDEEIDKMKKRKKYPAIIAEVWGGPRRPLWYFKENKRFKELGHYKGRDGMIYVFYSPGSEPVRVSGLVRAPFCCTMHYVNQENVKKFWDAIRWRGRAVVVFGKTAQLKVIKGNQKLVGWKKALKD